MEIVLILTWIYMIYLAIGVAKEVYQEWKKKKEIGEDET